MVTIKEVVSPKDLKTFIHFPWQVYKNKYPNWVPPLIMDMKAILDRKKSPFFEFGEAVYYLTWRDGKPVGRITAHIDHNHNRFHNHRDGYFGFYECLEDSEASAALLNAATNWVRQKGMTKVIGQLNFSIYDEIGFMVNGWDAFPATPVLLHTYTPPYYIAQLEAAGFAKEIDWHAFLVRRDFPIKDRLLLVKNRLTRRGITIRPIKPQHLNTEVEKIKLLFNKSWESNWGHTPLTDRQFDKIVEALKIMLDPEITLLAEKDDQLVGCSVSLPDLNPYVKKMNGRLFPFGIFHLLWGKNHAQGMRTLITGVDPDFRNIGVDIALIVETFVRGRARGYQWSDCSLIVETNHAMIEPIKKWGGEAYRTFRLFSRTL